MRPVGRSGRRGVCRDRAHARRGVGRVRRAAGAAVPSLWRSVAAAADSLACSTARLNSRRGRRRPRGVFLGSWLEVPCPRCEGRGRARRGGRRFFSGRSVARPSWVCGELGAETRTQLVAGGDRRLFRTGELPVLVAGATNTVMWAIRTSSYYDLDLSSRLAFVSATSGQP